MHFWGPFNWSLFVNFVICAKSIIIQATFPWIDLKTRWSPSNEWLMRKLVVDIVYHVWWISMQLCQWWRKNNEEAENKTVSNRYIYVVCNISLPMIYEESRHILGKCQCNGKNVNAKDHRKAQNYFITFTLAGRVCLNWIVGGCHTFFRLFIALNFSLQPF